MRGERHRPVVIGPLAGALLLHGLFLVLAACFGFRTAVQVEDAFDTFALSMRPLLAEDTGLAGTEAGMEVETEVGAGEADEEEEPTALLALEPMPEDLLPETSFLEMEEPVVLDPLPVEQSASDPSALVAEAPDALAPPPDSTASSSELGVGAQVEGIPLALRPRHARTWTSVLADVRDEHELAAVGPRPGKAKATSASAPRALVVRGPKAVETPHPSYPSLSRRAGEEGSVLCRLHISAAGAVTEVEVLESSGFERLDQSACATLLAWRFEPQNQEGRSVASTLLHRVTFRLES